MQTTLMNFGDNDRVISGTNNDQVLIGIGKVITADVHEVHYNMIKQGLATDTLIAVPKDLEITPKLAGIMELYQRIDSEEIDVLIARFDAIMGKNPEALRPSRDMMRIAMREVARQEVRKCLMNALTKRTAVIQEEGDEITRQEIETDDQLKRKKKKNKPATKAGNRRVARERL